MNASPRGERRKFNRLNSECPPHLMAVIRAEITQAIRGQGIKRGDTFADLVRRHCPKVFKIAEDEGFVLEVDRPENTHEALLQGRTYLTVKMATTRH